MTDRRPSLIDQMALAAALEADLDFSDDEDDSGEDLLLGDDEMEHPNDRPSRLIFNSDVIEEDEELEFEDEDDDTEYDLEDLEDVMQIALRQGRRNHTSNGTAVDYDEVASVPSANSEEHDIFVADPLPIGYQWRNVATTSLEDSVSSFASEAFDLEDQSGEINGKSASHVQQLRRASFQSLPDTSPTRTGNEPLSPGPGTAMPRRSHSIRRPSIKITVAGGASAVNPNDDDDASTSNASVTSSASTMFRFGRLSSLGNSRRQNLSIRSGTSTTNLDHALESLSTHNSNSEWENVAAAATVVAAGSQATGNSTLRHIKFAVDQTVLVLLTLLNVTNVEDPKDTFTVAPVNRCGFPQGEGRTEEERGGPYTFVLATVTRVHFDEDDRYYTVVRTDTGTEQRADSGT